MKHLKIFIQNQMDKEKSILERNLIDLKFLEENIKELNETINKRQDLIKEFESFIETNNFKLSTNEKVELPPYQVFLNENRIR